MAKSFSKILQKIFQFNFYFEEKYDEYLMQSVIDYETS